MEYDRDILQFKEELYAKGFIAYCNDTKAWYYSKAICGQSHWVRCKSLVDACIKGLEESWDRNPKVDYDLID